MGLKLSVGKSESNTNKHSFLLYFNTLDNGMVNNLCLSLSIHYSTEHTANKTRKSKG